MTINVTINGASRSFELNEHNATITRTMTGYNVTAKVVHEAGDDLQLIVRTAFIAGTAIKPSDLDKAFKPDKVAKVLSTDKVAQLKGVSPEVFDFIAVNLPDRPEYPSVKARREARGNSSK